MVYTLDTNIVIRCLRKEPRVLQNFDAAVTRGDDLVIPRIVDYEMRRGFRILSAPRKEAAYKVLAYGGGFCDVPKMDEYSWQLAEEVYADLHRRGLTIGELDILIAAFCLEKGYTLVTSNTRHFERVEGLKLIDWNA